MDFDTFIYKYKDDAMQFDLQKELPLVYNTLQEQIIKLQSAEFESEIKEVIEFSEKAIKDCKKMIIATIINKNYKAKFVNCTPSYVEYLRGYLDYSELNKKANNKLSNIQPQQQLTTHFSLYDINFQLANILKLIKEDLNKGYHIYNYLICEDEESFLNKPSLERYITETQINNHHFFYEINKKCTNIIKLWNEDLKNIPEKKLNESFSYTNEETKHFFTTGYDFYPIYLKKDKWEFYKLPAGKQFFFKNYKYTLYTLWDIAERCNLIRNWITASYPETNTINSNNTHLQTVKETEPTKETRNLHSEIFANNGFELFSYILENHIKVKGKRGRYADISFYYWKMFNNTPQYIHRRPEDFKNWFCSHYSDSFEKIKTLNEVADKQGNREKHYTTSLDWFKTSAQV